MKFIEISFFQFSTNFCETMCLTHGDLFVLNFLFLEKCLWITRKSLCFCCMDKDLFHLQHPACSGEILQARRWETDKGTGRFIGIRYYKCNTVVTVTGKEVVPNYREDAFVFFETVWIVDWFFILKAPARDLCSWSFQCVRPGNPWSNCSLFALVYVEDKK